MTNRSNEPTKVFHSVEEMKVALFPNMKLGSENALVEEELDEANSLAEKLIHDLMMKPKEKDG